MSGALDIRPARRDDAGIVLELIRELAGYERLAHMLVATEDRLAEELFGANSGAEVLLGLAAGTPVAYAVFFHNFSTFLGRKGLYLEDLFVRPQWRRRGYGRAMLLHVARIAHERGCGRFEWAVLDWNAPAISFYRSMGATVLDEWRICRVSGEALEHLAAKN